MKRKYFCIKNWEIDDRVYFEKGKYYEGKPYNDKNSVKMHGESGMKVIFHKGSKYFNI